MKQIEAVLNNDAKNKLLQNIKQDVTQALFIGAVGVDDAQLEALLSNPHTTKEDVSQHIISTQDVRSVFYDAFGNLSFEILLDYESSFEQYIYALAIAGEKDIYAIAKTPKIQKIAGVGGTFVFKTNIEGKNAQMVFKNDHYISEAELATFKAFVANIQTDINTTIQEVKDEVEVALTPIKSLNETLDAISKSIVLKALEDYIDKEFKALEKHKQEREKIGKKEYFLRNALPEGYVGMNEKCSAGDYFWLWFYTLGTACNNGGIEFHTPKSGNYSKGVENASEVGGYALSGLPNITGEIIVDRADSLYGNGVFEQLDIKDNFDVGRAWWANNYQKLRFDASRSSPIYGRTDEVETNRIHYLEGIYAGKPIDYEQAYKRYEELKTETLRPLYGETIPNFEYDWERRVTTDKLIAENWRGESLDFYIWGQ